MRRNQMHKIGLWNCGCEVMAVKSKCELVRNGDVRRRGNTADKIITESKVVYTCYGYAERDDGQRFKRGDES